MGDFGLRKNSEGYNDPTAYYAIRGMAKSGEVWTYSAGGYEKQALIIKNNGNYCNVLTLQDEQKNAARIEVYSDSLHYTDPGMLCWLFSSTLGMRVAVLPEAEFEAILDEVQDALGLELVTHTEGGNVDTEAMEKELIMMKHELDTAKAACASMESLEVQLETYKGLYVDLLNKLLKRMDA